MTKKRKSSEEQLDTTKILSHLGICPGQTILDAGCGDGYMAKKFSTLVGNSGKIYALDYRRELINTLHEEVIDTNIETLVGDITTTTKLEPCSIDLVYLSTVFHIFSPAQVVMFEEEMQRVLRPNAQLAIVNVIKEETPCGPPLKMRSSPEELRSKISLTPTKLVEVNMYFYMQIFQKK